MTDTTANEFQTYESWAFDEAKWGEVDRRFGGTPGIYHVILKNEDATAPQPIPRLLGVDPRGILYIGTASSLIGRFGGLRLAIYGAYNFLGDRGNVYTDYTKHSAGRLMKECGFPDKIAKERIFIEVEGYGVDATPPEGYNHFLHEGCALRTYLKEFGELPPFNSASGKEEKVIPDTKPEDV